MITELLSKVSRQPPDVRNMRLILLIVIGAVLQCTPVLAQDAALVQSRNHRPVASLRWFSTSPPPASLWVAFEPGRNYGTSALVAFRAGRDPATHRPATRVIATHAAIGTGAGLLTGFLLSGASIADDRSTVVLTWTALGAAAGVASGVITWLLS